MLTDAESVRTGAKSVCTGAESICTGAESIYTGAESIYTGAESLGSAPVSVLRPIVPAPAAESRAAGCWNSGGTACAPGTPTISSTGFSESSTSVS